MLHNVSRSLEDMLGKAYMDTVQETAVTLLGLEPDELECNTCANVPTLFEGLDGE